MNEQEQQTSDNGDFHGTSPCVDPAAEKTGQGLSMVYASFLWVWMTRFQYAQSFHDLEGARTSGRTCWRHWYGKEFIFIEKNTKSEMRFHESEYLPNLLFLHKCLASGRDK